MTRSHEIIVWIGAALTILTLIAICLLLYGNYQDTLKSQVITKDNNYKLVQIIKKGDLNRGNLILHDKQINYIVCVLDHPKNHLTVCKKTW